MTAILVTTANGDTGRPMVGDLLDAGFDVRAMVRKDDERAQQLRDMGAEVALGDLLDFRAVRQAMTGVQRAYFNYPVGEGLVEAAVMFSQAAKEQDLELIVNMSHVQSRPDARSKATQNHWLSEQVFDWSGVPTANLRVTMFMQWILYISDLIRRGRYVMPFDPDARFAAIDVGDIASTAAKMLAKPEVYGGKVYTVTGSVEYTYESLAVEVSRVLGVDLTYEQVPVTTFLELIGQADDTAKLKHFESAALDGREGRLAGITDVVPNIIGRPLVTVEDFINNNRELFELHYPTPAA